MLKDQLKKASAVLAVLDYTQLKSDADAQVRENLVEISDTARGRVYALVNKFDQKDRNSDDEAAVRKYVAQTLMKDAVAEAHVFPVSANQGYLASRARNEIERNGKLPARQPWIRDFGEEAFGRRWEKLIDDPREVKEGADVLWQESGFALPLAQVIVEAHQNAALEALRSAASKLAEYARDAGNFFKANVGALRKSAADLQKNIKTLQQDIERIARIEKDTEKALKDAMKNMQGKLKGATERVRKEVDETLEGYFKEGKSIKSAGSRTEKGSAKKPRKKKEPEPESGNLLAGWFRAFPSVSEKSENSSERDFDPGRRVIKYDKKSEANRFMERIEESIRNVMKKAEDDCRASIQSSIDEFAREFDSHRAGALENIRESVQKNLDGFDIDIRLPSARNIEMDVSVAGIVRGAIKKKTRTVTCDRRQSGLWGGICKLFGTDDWGWESSEEEEKYYAVDLNKIAKSSKEGVETLFSSAHSALDGEIYPQLQSGVEAFFGAFREKVEHVRGDLMAGIQKHDLDRARKAEILKDSETLAREASGLEQDCATLNDKAETLRRDEGVSIPRNEAQA